MAFEAGSIEKALKDTIACIPIGTLHRKLRIWNAGGCIGGMSVAVSVTMSGTLTSLENRTDNQFPKLSVV